MTISSPTIPRKDYTGDGATATYPFDWKITDKSHLAVYVATASGSESDLMVDDEYTVSGVGEEAGGSITLTAGNLEANAHLVILPNVPHTQPTQLPDRGRYSGPALEARIDAIVRQVQQLRERSVRSVVARVTDNNFDAALPSPVAGTLLAVRDDGVGFELVAKGEGGGGGGGGGTASAFTIDVKSHGAKGDGVTDDTSAIQAALTAADTLLTGMLAGLPAFTSGASVVVFFPAGRYKLTAALDWKGQSLVGEGSGSTFLLGAAGCDILHASTADLGGQQARGYGQVRGLTLIADDTVDASGSFSRGGVGNACMAFDETDHATQPALRWALYFWTIEDVVMETAAKTYHGQNKSCAFFNRRLLYGTTFRHVKIWRFDYGYWEDYTSTNITSNEYAQDYDSFCDVQIEGCKYGLRHINGLQTMFDNVQVYVCSVRSWWIDAVVSAIRDRTFSADFRGCLMENGVGDTAMVITGRGHVFDTCAWIGVADANMHLACEGSTFRRNTFSVLGTGKVKIDADDIVLEGANLNTYSDIVIGDNVRGFRHTVARIATYPTSPNQIDAVQGRHWTMGLRDRGAVDDGSVEVDGPYLSRLDLFIDPADIYLEGSVGLPTVTTDTTLPFGHYYRAAVPGSWAFSQLASQKRLVVGRDVPKGKVRIYFRLRLPSGAGTQVANAYLNNGGTFLVGKTFTLTTAWSTQFIDVDLSAAVAGTDYLQIQMAQPNTNQASDVAWVAIRPWDYSALVQGYVDLGGPQIIPGTGDPEGNVPAISGSLFVRKGLTGRKVLYYKTNDNVGSPTSDSWHRILGAQRTESGGSQGEQGQIGENTDVHYVIWSVNGAATAQRGFRYLEAGQARIFSYLNQDGKHYTDTYDDSGNFVGAAFVYDRAKFTPYEIRNRFLHVYCSGPSQADAMTDATYPMVAFLGKWNDVTKRFHALDVQIDDAACEANSTLVRYLTANGGNTQWCLDVNGRVYSKPPGTAPTDAQIMTGGFTVWLDEAANALKFRVRYSDGTTYKSGSIALA